MGRKIIDFITIVMKVLLIHILSLTTSILLIWWLLSKWTLFTPFVPSQPTMNITWSSPDSFPYDGNSHELTVSGYPAGATVDYTGGEDGSNGATSKGSWSITATVSAPDYQTWTGTHVLTIGNLPASNLTVTISSWTPSTPTYGYTTRPEATLSYTGGTINGGTITYSMDSTSPNPNDFDIVGTTLKLKLGKNASTYKCKIKATITGDTDYTDGNLTTSAETSIVILKAQLPSPIWTLPNTFTYDGNSHSISITNLPTGVVATYSGGEDGANSATNVGEWTITASVNGGINYQTNSFFGFIKIEGLPFPVTPTWSSTDTFAYDGSSHSISITNAPAGSTVTYTGGEDGANGATTTGTYTITATITLNNYETWTGTHVLTINPSNYIILNDTTKKFIDVSYNNFLTNRTTSGTFNFTDLSGTSQTITRTDIKEMHLTDLPQITTAPANYLMYMCYGMTNLTVADIQIPNTITTIGHYFCSYMFYDCNKLTSLPSGFNLPQGITSSGNGFCQQMFYNCTSLPSLPLGFNLSTGITTVGNMFCYAMFQNCTSLTSLPSGFNLPQGITSVGNSFSLCIFYNCTSLQSLPSGFNIPQNITSIGEAFCEGMFYGCSGLRNNSTNLITIIIPNPSSTGANFCKNMFYGCTGLTSVPETPTAGSTVKINAS